MPIKRDRPLHVNDDRKVELDRIRHERYLWAISISPDTSHKPGHKYDAR